MAQRRQSAGRHRKQDRPLRIVGPEHPAVVGGPRADGDVLDAAQLERLRDVDGRRDELCGDEFVPLGRVGADRFVV